MNNPSTRAIGKHLCKRAIEHLAKREVNATAHVTDFDDSSVTVEITMGQSPNAIEIELSYYCGEDGEAPMTGLRCRDLALKDPTEEDLPLPWKDYWANAVTEFLENGGKRVFVTEEMLDFMLEKQKNRHPATQP